MPRATMTMSYLDAAEVVLRKHPPRTALRCSRILELAVKQGLLSPTGATPEATMDAAITRDIKRRGARGDEPRFTKLARGEYGLATSARKGRTR